jgi:hypothetical protein
MPLPLNVIPNREAVRDLIVTAGRLLAKNEIPRGYAASE